MRLHHVYMAEEGAPEGGFGELSEPQQAIVAAKGWEKPSDMAQSYMDLEAHMGVPEERLLHIPADPENLVETHAFLKKLGRPETSDEYDLPVPEGQENVLLADFKDWAHASGLTQKQAAPIVQAFNDKVAGIVKDQEDAAAAQFTTDDNALKKEWGAEYDANIQFGQQFAAAFGLKQEFLAKVEGMSGYAEFMKGCARVGRAMGESKIAIDDTPSEFGMTPGAAQAKIAELRGSAEWTARATSDDETVSKAANAEIDRLYDIAYPGGE